MSGGNRMDADLNAVINILRRVQERGKIRPDVKTRTAA